MSCHSRAVLYYRSSNYGKPSHGRGWHLRNDEYIVALWVEIVAGKRRRAALVPVRRPDG